MIAWLERRINNLIARAVLCVLHDGKMQTGQFRVLSGEVKDKVDFPENYGFTSRAHAGSEAVILFPGGDRSHGIAIITSDRRYRLQIAEGEVAVHDDQNQRVYLKRDRIEVYSPLNVRIRSDGELVMSGKHVRVHADEILDWDVHGYGPQRLTWLGGNNFKSESWTIGAVVTSVSYDYNPSEIPRPWA